MKCFPEFIKRKGRKVCIEQQNTADIEGHFFEDKDGAQIAFWECNSDQSSKTHSHDFDEYMVCMDGEYIAHLDDKEYILGPGDELFIPKGTEQWSKCRAGTRTIHVFEGKRIK
jgi:quercetin dioxygenase-like cupin family protein